MNTYSQDIVLVNLNKPIFAKDKEDGKIYSVSSIHFPLNSPSGKDISIEAGDNLSEWRSFEEIELLQYE